MDTGDLFQKYLEICNKALEENKDRFPFKQILGAVGMSDTPPQNIEVSIIDDSREDIYVIYFDKRKIIGELHGNFCNCQCNGRWRVVRSYLENVIKNPEEYIRNPAKIDWDWVYNTEN